jgi:MoaA/NifB/PqqE/SkfB family radical SAM enzyme
MCPFWRRKYEDIAYEELCKILDQAHQIGIRIALAEGGEPLLRKDLPEILRHMKEKGWHVSINTNGWLLKERFEEIKDFVDQVIVSIDGLEKTHDKIRRLKGLFKRAIEGIEICKEGGVYVAVNYNIQKINYKETVQAIEFLLERCKVDSCYVMYAHNYRDSDDVEISREEKVAVYRKLLKLREKYPTGVGINQKVANICIGRERWRCHPYLFLIIDSEGNLRLPCYWIGYNEESMPYKINVLGGKLIRKWKDNLKIFDEFKDCTACAFHCHIASSLVYDLNLEIIRDLKALTGWKMW